MGMYTELVLKCQVRDNIPENVHSVLNYLFNQAEEPKELPAHEFFKCSRWVCIGNSSSFYHIPFSLSEYSTGLEDNRQGGYIFSRSDLKNYSNEIDLFIDWLKPYIEDSNYKCIGWKWYEEDDMPTLITI